VNGMFTQVRERSPVTAATPELLAALARLAEPAALVVPEPQPAAAVTSDSSDITDDEFELLLDSLNAIKADAPAIAASDDISDAEFESLLDQLHGKGRFSADTVADTVPDAVPAAAVEPAEAGNEITDDEFEALLDQLHGKGAFSSDALQASAVPVTEAAVSATVAAPS
ncbi:chemotaxis protein CheA, partial [Pseudomonas psychrophila]